jgi:hypothetical protein
MNTAIKLNPTEMLQEENTECKNHLNAFSSNYINYFFFAANFLMEELKLCATLQIGKTVITP